MKPLPSFMLGVWLMFLLILVKEMSAKDYEMVCRSYTHYDHCTIKHPESNYKASFMRLKKGLSKE